MTSRNQLSILLVAVDQASQVVSNVVNTVRGKADEMKRIGATLSAAVTLPIIGIGVASLTMAAQLEQTQVAFRTLVGDAKQAEIVLKDIQQFAASTPFQFNELADASRKLIAFGEGADTVVSTLERIGDVSAGVSQPIGEIADLYGKARIQGRLFAEDINQLTGRGIPIIQELAKQFGVTDSEVKKLVESGQVDFKNLEAAFVSLTSEGGKFTGLMAAQSQTLAGRWSTLKDNGVLLATNIGTLLLPIAGQLVDTFISLLGAVNQLPTPITTVGVVVAGAAAAIGPLLLGLGQLITVWPKVVLGAQKAGAAITALSGPIGIGIALATALYIAYQTNFLGIGDAVRNAVNWIGEQFERVRVFYRAATDNLDVLQFTFREIFTSIGHIFRGFSLIVWGFVVEPFLGILAPIGKAAEQVVNVLTGWVNSIADLFQPVVDFLQGIGVNIANGMRKLGEGAINGLKSLVSSGVTELEGVAAAGLASSDSAAEGWRIIEHEVGNVQSVLLNTRTVLENAMQGVNDTTEQTVSNMEALRETAEGSAQTFGVDGGGLPAALKTSTASLDTLSKATEAALKWTERLTTEVELGFKKPAEAAALLSPRLSELQSELEALYNAGGYGTEAWDILVAKIGLVEEALDRVSAAGAAALEANLASTIGAGWGDLEGNPREVGQDIAREVQQGILEENLLLAFGGVGLGGLEGTPREVGAALAREAEQGILAADMAFTFSGVGMGGLEGTPRDVGEKLAQEVQQGILAADLAFTFSGVGFGDIEGTPREVGEALAREISQGILEADLTLQFNGVGFGDLEGTPREVGEKLAAEIQQGILAAQLAYQFGGAGWGDLEDTPREEGVEAGEAETKSYLQREMDRVFGGGGLGGLEDNPRDEAAEAAAKGLTEAAQKEMEARQQLVNSLIGVSAGDGPILGFGKTLLGVAAQQIPVFGAALQGFVTAGPIGAITAIFGELLTMMEPFAKLIRIIMATLGVVAQVLGEILAPVFNFVGMVFKAIANAIIAIYNATLGRLFGRKIDKVDWDEVENPNQDTTPPPEPPEDKPQFTPINANPNPDAAVIDFSSVAPAAQLAVATPLFEAASLMYEAAELMVLTFSGGATGATPINISSADVARFGGHVDSFGAWVQRLQERGITIHFDAGGRSGTGRSNLTRNLRG